jgi:hypothetical protein
MQVRVPRIHIGDNLAQIKAMRLANVQTFGSQCFASKQSKKEIWLRRSQIYRGAQIEKWSFFMCSCVISQRNHDFGADTQIKKKLRWFSVEFLRVRRKITSTPSYAYLRICLFSKVITALVVRIKRFCS